MPASTCRHPSLVLLPLALLACAPAAGGPAPGAPPAAADVAAEMPAAAAPAAGERPLAPLVGRPALLFPLQAVSGAAVEPGALDAELAFALEERRASRAWTGPDALRRLARTSAAYASDPAALALPTTPLRTGADVRDPLASQLRALAALTDARVVVVPTLLRADTAGVALHVAVVDVRGARVLWAGTTAPVPLLPAASLPARVAERAADLAAPPPQT